MGFLQDSIIRPYAFNGTPKNLFKKFITDHNEQVDDFKKFKIGKITVVDPNNYISRSNDTYDTALSNLNSRLIDDSLGGYFYITHGDDGMEDIPTLNYLADFTNVSSQIVEFGSNLKDYTKTVKADTIATALIPIGAEINTESETNNDKPKERLTIKSVNGGKDYIYNKSAVSLYGWIFKTAQWDDVTDAKNLLTKAKAQLNQLINQNTTIELTAIDLHLLDKTIASFYIGDYVRVLSKPHNFDSTLLCNKQEIDLLKPDNDKLTLGYTYATFTDVTSKTTNALSAIPTIRSSVSNISTKLTVLSDDVTTVQGDATTISGDLETVAGVVVDNVRDTAANTAAIQKITSKVEIDANLIAANKSAIDNLIERIAALEKS